MEGSNSSKRLKITIDPIQIESIELIPAEENDKPTGPDRQQLVSIFPPGNRTLDPNEIKSIELIPSAENDEPTVRERQKLLSIFPPEIWSKILSNVDNNETYQKVSATCELFSSLLQEQRIYILLHEVLPVVLDCEVGIKLHDILPLRSVCHRWKHSVQQVIQSPGFYNKFLETFELKNVPNFADDEAKDLYEAKFRKSNQFTKFEQHFDPTHLNTSASPFLLQEVEVKGPPNCAQIFFEAFVNLLRKYGQHIARCTVIFETGECSPVFFYADLGDILNFMPNLECLELNCNVACLNIDMKNLQETYATKELPLHFKLRSMFTQNVPSFVMDKLFGVNRKIPNKAKDPILAYFESLPNVKNLTMEVKTEEDFNIFMGSAVETKPIKLQLTIDASAISVEKIFRALEQKFGEILYELHVIFQKSEKLEYKTGLALPSLTVLTVEMDYPKDINFILPLKPTLERLTFKLTEDPDLSDQEFYLARDKEDKLGGDGIIIYKYWKHQQYAKLWEDFPKLQFLRVKSERLHQGKTYMCSRKMWEDYQWIGEPDNPADPEFDLQFD